MTPATKIIAPASDAFKFGAHTMGDDYYTWLRQERRMLRYMLEQDGMQFMRYFFKIREGTSMVRNWHHYAIDHCLEAVYQQRLQRVIINIAPGFTKTEQAVVGFISRALARNPRAKFIHASGSGDLALDNSAKIREVITAPEFQDLWPMQIRVDTKGKKRWFTEAGGGMMAAAAGGQIMGFRAGRMEPGFTGAFVIDDPVKPDDAESTPRRTLVNQRFNRTIRGRLALETTPMIVIMQRLHEDDLSGFLLRGGSGDMWYHLAIPADITDETLTKPYNKEYTHGIKIDLDMLLQCLHFGENYDFQSTVH